jgi:hypothetical protein
VILWTVIVLTAIGILAAAYWFILSVVTWWKGDQL